MDGGREEEDALDGVGREAGGGGGVDEIHCFAGLEWLFGEGFFYSSSCLFIGIAVSREWLNSIYLNE